jgi:hypothetical protein
VIGKIQLGRFFGEIQNGKRSSKLSNAHPTHAESREASAPGNLLQEGASLAALTCLDSFMPC